MTGGKILSIIRLTDRIRQGFPTSITIQEFLTFHSISAGSISVDRDKNRGPPTPFSILGAPGDQTILRQLVPLLPRLTVTVFITSTVVYFDILDASCQFMRQKLQLMRILELGGRKLLQHVWRVCYQSHRPYCSRRC